MSQGGQAVARRTGRAARLEATREHIVSAAAALFARDGFIATTLEDIAAEAGVAIQTVYNVAGPKAQLLSLVLDRAAAGPQSPRGVAEFMRERVEGAKDGDAVVEVLADWFAEVSPRVLPVQRTIAEGAAVDAEIGKLALARAKQRYLNYHQAAKTLKRHGWGAGQSVEQMAATIWNVGNPQTYDFFVNHCGWSAEAYRRWLLHALRSGLR